MKILTILLSLLMVWVSSHAEEIFPKGCTPLVIEGELITIPSSPKQIVMIHNLSTVDLWITHPVSEPGVSAGWSSQLQAGRWSALTMNNAPFELSCIESRPGHEQQISCKNVVGVCTWHAKKSPKKSNDVYWAGENMALSPLIAYIGRRGFILVASLSNKMIN